MKKMRSLLLSVLLLCVSANVYAACVPADLPGKYTLYIGFGADTAWCHITVLANGTLQTGKKCVLTDGPFTSESETTGGALQISKNCFVRGFVEYDGCRGDIVRASMSRDKDIIAGVGQDCSNIDGSFTLIKR